jgi:lipopolysaccharide transport system permease protein
VRNNYKDLLIELTRKEIKIRYKNSYLGYFWSLLNPLVMALVFYFVFQVISRTTIEQYALFLVSGLFVWQWIANSLTVSTMLFVGNAQIIKKVNFPRYFLGIALVFSEGFNFIISIIVIIGFMAYYSLAPTLYWLIGIPILFVITSVFLFGLSLFLATLNLFFRDLERMITLMMMILFYATPILYSEDMLPEKYKIILYLNPFTPFVLMWKELFLEGVIDYTLLTHSIINSTIAVFIGTFIYNKLKLKFAELV